MLVIVPSAWATHDSTPSPRDKDAREFVSDVPTSRIVHHQYRLQEIARANGDTRHTLTDGYEDSLDYVESTLRRAGYSPKRVPFNFPFWEEVAPASITRVSPLPVKPYRYGTEADNNSPDVDFITLGYSGTGTLTNTQVVPTNDIGTIPPATAGSSTSGCEPEDYPAAVAGKIALVMRGTCAFVQKAEVAQAQGAAGVIIFNDGVGAGRQNPTFVLNQVDLHIPAVISSFAMGKELYDAVNAGQDVRLDFSAFGQLTDRFRDQILAETKGGDSKNVLIVGAHLDGRVEGPGINDDGSGSATQLEVAQQMAALNINTRNKVRFIWFSGEEQGLFGSTFNADNLTKVERSSVIAMLDFDMLASPNYALQIYDGDGSEFGVAGPNGSGTIEKVFQTFFNARGVPTERIAFDGRSDYDEYTTVGIPAGGIATGAEVHKTPAQQEKWGGTVSSGLDGQFDPCYHLACDRSGINGSHDNINNTALSIMSDAVANAVLTFAQTTSATNGTGKGSPGATKPYDWKGNTLRK